MLLDPFEEEFDLPAVTIKVGVDSPIAYLVGIGQRIASNSATYPYMIELLALSSKVNLGLSETLSIGQLSKGHAEILIQTTERFDFVISVVGSHATVENLHGDMLYYLSEDKLADMHDSPLIFR